MPSSHDDHPPLGEAGQWWGVCPLCTSPILVSLSLFRILLTHVTPTPMRSGRLTPSDQALSLNHGADNIWSYLRMTLSCMDRSDLVSQAGPPPPHGLPRWRLRLCI